MNEVYVADMAAATALGASLDLMWPRLHRGESAIGPVSRFPTEQLPFHAAACATDLDQPDDGDPNHHPNRVCRLMDRCLSEIGPLPPATFVIWAGVKGNAQWIEERRTGRAPTALYLPRHYRDWVDRRLGLSGKGLELNAACASSAAALALGAQMIRAGEVAGVLVCAADVVSHFTFTGFAALRSLTQSACRPFDVDRDGLALGDGAGAMWLAGADEVRRHGRRPLARLTGWGIANDATHITAPARDGAGLAAAITMALGVAGHHDRAPTGADGMIAAASDCAERIGGFCAHGTGTVYNDAMELTALEQVFGACRFPAFSVKGAIGHTLGAAGVIEAALSVRALGEGRVPPTAGLVQPEPRAAERFADRPQTLAEGAILTTNSGFGGVNAALLFEKAKLPG